MKTRSYLQVLVVCLTTSWVFTPAQALDAEYGWWLGASAKRKISGPVSGSMETQIRSGFEDGKVNQILFRTGLLYRFGETSHEVGGLLGYIQSGANVERRYTLQHAMAYVDSDPNKLSHRVRFEVRDFENTSDDAIRLRYSLKYVHDFGAFRGVLSNEVFLNATDEDARNQEFVDQNRAFLGVSFPVYATSLEIGYLNQTVFFKAEDTMNHLLVLSWSF